MAVTWSGVEKRPQLGIDTRLRVLNGGSAECPPTSRSSVEDALSSAPDPYKVATGFLIDSYERTIAILEAERDYLEARLQKAEGKS